MRKDFAQVLLVFFGSYAILFCFLGTNIFQPNDFVYAFGGDASFIYFNMLFHTAYGSGWTLSNVNYPFFESLLMTDAQATLSYVLHLISGEWINSNVIGISHSIHYLLLALASVYACKGLTKLGVSKWMAVIFSLLIVFMSPQIIRLRFGHFGLVYPFLFTYLFYQLIDIKKELEWTKFWKIGVVILLFGINNIYLLVLGSGMVFLYALAVYLKDRDLQRVLPLLLAAIVPLVLTFGLLHFSTPVTDRLDIQWGYYANRARIEHLFYPFTSLVGTFFQIPKDYIESANNLGLVNGLAIAYFIYLCVKKRAFLLGFIKSYSGTPMMNLFIASFILFLYGTGIFRFAEEYLSMATMFKASGRFAWPLYFVISYASVVWLDGLLKERLNGAIKYLIILPIAIWSYECYNYLEHHVKFNQFKNEFSKEILNDLKDKMVNAGIEYHNYHGLFSLPMAVAWNDKFDTRGDWFTEFSSIKVSLASGLPLINGCISRLGVTDGMRMINFGSHPWITKEIPSVLSNEKDVLLVVSKNITALTEGERYLMDKATLLLKDEYFSLYGLKFKDLQNNEYDSLDSLASTSDQYVYMDFNDTDGEKHFGKGSITITRDTMFYQFDPSAWKSGQYEASYYFLMNHKKFGTPYLVVKSYKEGKLIKTNKISGGKSRNADGMWRRSDVLFNIEEGMDSIACRWVNIKQPFIMDEFLIRSTQDTIIIRPDSHKNGFLINNYLLRN